MNTGRVRFSIARLAAAAGLWLLAGCGSGDDGLENKNPGANDLNVVVAFGDSITAGVGDGIPPGEYVPSASGSESGAGEEPVVLVEDEDMDEAAPASAAGAASQT